MISRSLGADTDVATAKHHELILDVCAIFNGDSKTIGSLSLRSDQDSQCAIVRTSIEWLHAHRDVEVLTAAVTEINRAPANPVVTFNSDIAFNPDKIILRLSLGPGF